ncbi:hypothetical protein F5884DRAFT_100567 [Xylogone sp. PMI_703]|nr:hypothetical protein F5884DRAFT_100567 [Xylogone sp. PMI_703]
MAILRTLSIVVAITHQASALQVTPNSPCAEVCLNDPTQDPSDPNVSNTYGSEIACTDSSYDTSTVGQKFKSCVNCLRNSTAHESGESDQSWFLYNLRFALDSCLFNFANTTDQIVDSPCFTDFSCAPLQTALENGNLDADNLSEFSYCTADDNAIMGSSLTACRSCLQETPDEQYLANFLTALQAGCTQRPSSSLVIGLQGSLFSTTPVNITFPGDTGVKHKHHGLGQSAIIGIVVGVVGAVILACGIFLICFRKARNRKKLKALRSPLDPRFGALNITAPNDGSYATPSNSPGFTIKPYRGSVITNKEVDSMNTGPTYASQSPNSFVDAHAHRTSTQPPEYSATQMPTHQAYIPHGSPISPATTNTIAENYQLDTYRSAEISPKDFPGASNSTATTATSPNFQLGPPPSRTLSRNRYTQSEPKYSPPPLITPSSIMTTISQPVAGNNWDASNLNTPLPPRTNVYDPRGLYTQSQEPTQPSQQSQKVGRSFSMKGLLSSKSKKNAPPLVISGPMIRAEGRYESNMGDRERWEAEGQRMEMQHTRTPQSVDSGPEQWPGDY